MLEPLNMQNLCQNSFTSLIVGRKCCGKTTLIKNMVTNLFESGITRFRVVTPTPQEWESDTVALELKNLEQIWEDQKHFSRETNSKLVIILDNCGYSRKIMNSDVLREIIINGPYYHTTLICTVQYLGDISPSIQSCFDIIFVFQRICAPASLDGSL